MFGVEAVSPGRPGRNNFEVHHVCRDMGFTHMEGLVNLDRLVGRGEEVLVNEETLGLRFVEVVSQTERMKRLS